MREWFYEHSGPLAVAIGIIVSVCICVLLVIALHSEAVQWQNYSDAHHCHKVGVKKGQIEPVLGGKGGATMGQDQTIYVCDEGEIVIR